DVLPGVPVWYASTCRECSAGCGILVKQREGRAIKIEGNPAHPLSRGGLCARGHAALQGLYDADRVRTPMRKDGGAWKAITWEEGLALVYEPFAYESLREANRRSFGQAAVPEYDFAAARYVLSFGADFLETFA